MQNQESHDDIITYSKAICIMLVVAGHTVTNQDFIQFINFFEVPFFFFSSGYCFKKKYLKTPKDFIMKRIKGLWKPFVTCTVLFVLLHNLLISLRIYDGNNVEPYNLTTIINKMLLAVVMMSNTEMIIGAIWFLRSLLIASLVAFFFIKIFKSYVYAFVVSYVLTMISTLFFPYFSVFGWIEHFFFATAIFLLGAIFRKTKMQICGYFVFTGCFLLLCMGVIFSSTAIRHFTFYNLLWLTACTPAGIMLTLKIAKIIESCRIEVVKRTMRIIGEHTLSILLFHFLAFKIVSIVIVSVFNLSWNHVSDFPVVSSSVVNRLWRIMYIIVGLSVPLLLLYCYNRIIALVSNKI